MSGSSGGDDPVTPTNVIIRRQTTTGDAKIRPIVVDNAILHVQRNGDKLYEMTYSIQSYGYDDADITQFAEHITKGGIIDIAYARQPDGIIFCVRSDGVLLGLVHHLLTYGASLVVVFATDGQGQVYATYFRGES